MRSCTRSCAKPSTSSRARPPRGSPRRVAEVLEAGGRADPAELAHHFIAAGDRAKGVEYSVAGARRALDGLAFEDAARTTSTRSTRSARRTRRDAATCCWLSATRTHAQGRRRPPSARTARRPGSRRSWRCLTSSPERRSDTADGCSGRSRATIPTSGPARTRPRRSRRAGQPAAGPAARPARRRPSARRPRPDPAPRDHRRGARRGAAAGRPGDARLCPRRLHLSPSFARHHPAPGRRWPAS